ncbi:hypothetical protein HY493_01465 [Candidatus Woesearchaeota archaeon]|nr:hypothetical protein [Candidatus Woesearchaeota archaeon]
MPSITLGEVVTAGYDRIVFDTSILEATHASPDIQRAYRRTVRRELARQEFVTVRPVLEEAQRHFWNRESRELIRNVEASCYDITPVQNEYREWYNLLEQEAARRGIIPKDLSGRRTDVKLASLAFTLGRLQPVAFISGDRALVDMVFDWQRLAPGIIDPFYFWQAQAKFVPYTAEDAQQYRSRMRIAV